MPDRHTIHVFMNGMMCMCLLMVLAMGGTFLYNRWTHDPAEDAAFEAMMQEQRAFLAEHERRREESQQRMDAYWQKWESRRQAREAHDEVPREEKVPCP